MKVVLFCGGLGMRLREFSDKIPKPMVPVGGRPIIWHLMKYYAHFGHKEFILCLGHQADVIKRYFLEYDECLNNDFVLNGETEGPKLLKKDIHDWKITFVDTGLNSNVATRLKKVQKFIGDDEFFMANYSDALSDLHLSNYIDFSRQKNKIASFICIRPNISFHFVDMDEKSHQVKEIKDLSTTGLTVNGGFFVFNRKIFDYIKEGEELVNEPFHRLIQENQLIAYPFNGFWACMDTFKDKQLFDELSAKGHTPWQLWQENQDKA